MAVSDDKPPPSLVVEITLKDVYDLLVTTNTQLVDLRADVRGLMEQGRDHEQRLRALERGRWPLPALGAVLSFAALLVSVLPHIQFGGR